jgi:glycoside/pentoside/hexuronide:cation symporter, GPH family
VLHQSWAARLGGDEAQQGRIVSAREAFGLVGVLLASVLAAEAGMGFTTLVFAAALATGVVAWKLAPRPIAGASVHAPSNTWLAWTRPRFRRLIAVFLLNGIASAVPATLFLFFVQDRLEAKAGTEGPLLAAYFLCAALSIPLWLKCVARIGLARTWLIGMVLSVAVFIWAATLGAGDLTGFVVVCVLSGAALGTDLALPSAMLTGVIQREGDAQQHEGAYFGWWNFATKLNLAAAAGLSLPLLQWFGYTPGARDPAALNALVIAYCLLPCVLKCLAAAALYFGIIRSES